MPKWTAVSPLVTDWLSNPDTILILNVPVALICALVLVLTRGILPPTKRRWRLVRALFICVCAGLSSVIAAFIAPGYACAVLLNTGGVVSRSTIHLAAFVFGNGLIMGWLVLWLIEGRMLRQMGWGRQGWVKYALVGGVGGLVLGAILPVRPFEFLTELGEQPTGNLGMLCTVPWHFLVVCAIFALATGWSEENIFRGYLLATLREVGLSGAKANLIQALVFAAYHAGAIAVIVRSSQAPTTETVGQAIGSALVMFGGGLILGLMRIRTRSIVMSFGFHATYDAIIIMLSLAPVVALVHSLGAL